MSEPIDQANNTNSSHDSNCIIHGHSRDRKIKREEKPYSDENGPHNGNDIQDHPKAPEVEITLLGKVLSGSDEQDNGHNVRQHDENNARTEDCIDRSC